MIILARYLLRDGPVEQVAECWKQTSRRHSFEPVAGVMLAKANKVWNVDFLGLEKFRITQSELIRQLPGSLGRRARVSLRRSAESLYKYHSQSVRTWR